ncbi:MAG: sugar-binding protein, partial [Verrucomicrobiota bacterium]|nr:sugar-binding protein [Verrucomicrobiota bacterium]
MSKTTRGGGLFASALMLLAGVFSLNAQNGIEPRYEKYNADRKSIEVDGDLSDWAGVTFIEPRFEASDGRETGKGNTEIDGTTYSTFAEFGGGTWSGPDDHTTSIAVAWDFKGLYLGIVVTDDEHEHAAGNAWNGDGVQMGLTDPERATVTHLYNYCIRDGYESGKVYKNGDAGIIADKEKGPGNYSVAMVRDDAAKTTTYEALFTPDSFGFEQFEIGQQFGFGVCVNDGDADTPGQKGWSGWGPHMIVFGKTAPDAALVTLTGLEVISSFSEDFNGEDGEHSELITLEGTAAHTEGELIITEAANSQNGGALLEDFSDGAAFSNFELSFRLFMGNGTARPADGFSVSIDNDLPNLASPAEEGAGNGLKICFDAWDSGGGDLAPQIEVFYGGESQAMQSFTGETDVPEADRFADEDGNLVTLWDNEEWADVKISVIDGLLNLDFRGHSIFADKVISSGVFEGPSWLFAARTGGANQAHKIDDLSITLYSAGGPLVTSFNGGPGGFDVSIADAEGNGVDLDSVAVNFDGEAVEVAKSKT